MKNLRIKVIENCFGDAWWFGIYEGREELMSLKGKPHAWLYKKAAIRNAKAMAKRIGIKFDSEIVKMHGC